MAKTFVAILLMVSAGACASSQGAEPLQPMANRRGNDPCDQYTQRPGTDRERTAQDSPEECWPVLNEPSIALSYTAYSPAPQGERTGQSMPASAVAQPVGKAPQ